MNHLMLDIETLGTSPGSAILQISAIPFSFGGLKYRTVFNEAISIQSCVDNGLKLDSDTALWWLRQEKALEQWVLQEKLDLITALSKFKDYINTIEGLVKDNQNIKDKEIYVWGNSNRFDMGLLEAAYQAIGEKIPWKFRNERDVRTLVSFVPEIKEQVIKEYRASEKILHNAFVDCEMQIEYCTKIFNTIKIDESRLPKSS